MFRNFFAAFVILIGAISVLNYVRGEEYSSATLYVSERPLSNVMTCISGKSEQIKSDLEQIGSCDETGSRYCQPGMTYVSADRQMRLSVTPVEDTVEIKIRHNQPLSTSALATLERCAKMIPYPPYRN